MSEFSYDVKLY